MGQINFSNNETNCQLESVTKVNVNSINILGFKQNFLDYLESPSV